MSRAAWLRFWQRYESREGPALEMTWWERWTLAPDRQRVQAIELVAVTDLA